MAGSQQTLVEVDIGKIHLNPYQPRRSFSDEGLEELAQSIVAVGLLHPPLVRPIGDLSDTFELVSGERRFRAAQMAGLKTIPVVIVNPREKQFSAEAALIENIQRVDLNPMDIAKGLRRLMNEFGYLQEDLAQRIGKKRSTIANYLRLLSLPREIQDSVELGQISMGHAKTILSLDQLDQQIYLFRLIASDELSVRDAERAAKKIASLPQHKQVAAGDCFLRDLQDKLQQRFGTKVVVQGEGQKGRLCFEYYTLDDLDRLLQLWGFIT